MGTVWRPASVTAAAVETASARTLTLDVPGWPGSRSGQHLEVRLTAEDGETAVRGYSVASAPGEPVQITVERLADGEVSPWLVDEARPGDTLEVRGPLGGWFTWAPRTPSRPLLLVGGGSGVVPLRAVLRARLRSGDATPVRLLRSARRVEDLLYREELERAGGQPGVRVVSTLTGPAPEGWPGPRGRVDRALLATYAWPVDRRPEAYVCGSTPFVEAVADALVALGLPPEDVRTERYGGA